MHPQEGDRIDIVTDASPMGMGAFFVRINGVIVEFALDELFFEFAFEQSRQVVSKLRFSLAKRVRAGFLRGKTDGSVGFFLSNERDTEIRMVPASFEGRIVAPALIW